MSEIDIYQKLSEIDEAACVVGNIRISHGVDDFAVCTIIIQTVF